MTWQPTTWQLRHRHGLFSCWQSACGGGWTAHYAGTADDGTASSEPLGAHPTLASAQAACAGKVALLDAAESEQLEANREEVVCR